VPPLMVKDEGHRACRSKYSRPSQRSFSLTTMTFNRADLQRVARRDQFVLRSTVRVSRVHRLDAVLDRGCAGCCPSSCLSPADRLTHGIRHAGVHAPSQEAVTRCKLKAGRWLSGVPCTARLHDPLSKKSPTSARQMPSRRAPFPPLPGRCGNDVGNNRPRMPSCEACAPTIPNKAPAIADPLRQALPGRGSSRAHGLLGGAQHSDDRTLHDLHLETKGAQLSALGSLISRRPITL
jgi:hypothetical protein